MMVTLGLGVILSLHSLLHSSFSLSGMDVYMEWEKFKALIFVFSSAEDWKNVVDSVSLVGKLSDPCQLDIKTNHY